jgi:hypothetical protein
VKSNFFYVLERVFFKVFHFDLGDVRILFYHDLKMNVSLELLTQILADVRISSSHEEEIMTRIKHSNTPPGTIEDTTSEDSYASNNEQLIEKRIDDQNLDQGVKILLNFQSARNATKMVPLRPSRLPDSGGIFTFSNGVRMEKISRSVRRAKQAKI